MKPLVILDTSVLISYCVSKNITHTHEIIGYLQKKKIRAFLTKESQEELRASLKKLKLQPLIAPRKESIEKFITWYERVSEKVIIDSDRNMFLVLADKVKAHAIITVDNDLLVLKKYKKTLILRPKDFILWIAS